MKTLLIIFFSISLNLCAQEFTGSVLENQDNKDQLHFECEAINFDNSCNQYSAHLTNGLGVRTLINKALYIATVDKKNFYITGEPINYKTYNLTRSTWNAKFFKNDNKALNILLNTLRVPASAIVGIAETLIDQPQNAYKFTKKLILKKKYRKHFINLYQGPKDLVSIVKKKRFEKIVLILKNL